MEDVLLPRTDAGVIVQLLVAAVVLATAWWMARRRPEFRVLVAGVGLTFLGFVGVRALH